MAERVVEMVKQAQQHEALQDLEISKLEPGWPHYLSICVDLFQWRKMTGREYPTDTEIKEELNRGLAVHGAKPVDFSPLMKQEFFDHEIFGPVLGCKVGFRLEGEVMGA